ncbi:Uncharacterised protein [Vibrio cholerae]|uniref:Uncharacterized protein n=1 Tax=Vibrio cholerae TaxID=666 RepID=A0A655Z1Q6_VIBCL|nr:Uncharacterised protein [Vibrio cholerae]
MIKADRPNRLTFLHLIFSERVRAVSYFSQALSIHTNFSCSRM